MVGGWWWLVGGWWLVVGGGWWLVVGGWRAPSPRLPRKCHRRAAETQTRQSVLQSTKSRACHEKARAAETQDARAYIRPLAERRKAHGIKTAVQRDDVNVPASGAHCEGPPHPLKASGVPITVIFWQWCSELLRNTPFFFMASTTSPLFPLPEDGFT